METIFASTEFKVILAILTLAGGGPPLVRLFWVAGGFLWGALTKGIPAQYRSYVASIKEVIELGSEDRDWLTLWFVRETSRQMGWMFVTAMSLFLSIFSFLLSIFSEGWAFAFFFAYALLLLVAAMIGSNILIFIVLRMKFVSDGVTKFVARKAAK